MCGGKIEGRAFGTGKKRLRGGIYRGWKNSQGVYILYGGKLQQSIYIQWKNKKTTYICGKKITRGYIFVVGSL